MTFSTGTHFTGAHVSSSSIESRSTPIRDGGWVYDPEIDGPDFVSFSRAELEELEDEQELDFSAHPAMSEPVAWTAQVELRTGAGWRVVDPARKRLDAARTGEEVAHEVAQHLEAVTKGARSIYRVLVWRGEAGEARPADTMVTVTVNP